MKEEKLEDIFKKTARAEIKSKEFKEKKNRWVRCVLTSPLSITSNLKLPVLDTVFTKSAPLTDIPPDAAFFNDVPLEFPQKKLTTKVIQCSDIDIEEDDEFICVESTEGFNADDAIEIFRNGDSVGLAIIIKVEVDPPKVKVEGTRPIVGDFIHKLSKIRPFGIQPRIYDAVYIASQEAFSKKDSEITLSLLLDHEDTSKGLEPKPNPKLSWEYWNGKGWQVIRELQDGTSNFINQDHQKVLFTIPEDFQQIEVSGQKNYWIRARIVGGDYGRDEYTITDKKIITAAPKYKIPIIYDLKLGYEFKERVELQQSLTYNNLDFQDVTEASRKKGEPITPFTRTEDENRNFYLGFSRKLVGGPIRIFFSAKELEFAEATKPKVDWNYRRKDRWFVLDYRDETEGFITQGHLDFIGQSDFTEFSLFGQSCYWLQGSHVKGSYDSLPEIYGIYPNTTWAIQAETIKDEILGSSNGEPNQSFSFLKTPVIEGQEIRIRETLSNEERQSLMKLKGENSIFEVKDEKGKVLETWILWKEVPGFFDSKANSRHYTLDRALGRIQFGNGTNGM
ncbi:MAG TPA: hypothetical protein VLH08_17895, partial [Acidobacteriota bacterium]|nr:hypothetical protein [Acidobacteriota bacterium]